MKVEVLFPEFCNLYGDLANIKYLEKSVKDIEVIHTPLTGTPRFISDDIDMVYMCSMTEKTQEKVIEKLKPYTEKIKELINGNKLFLCTGNAFEVFGNYIENEDGSKIEGLKVLDCHSKRDMLNRHASMFLGEFEDLKMIGFKNQFSQTYGDNANCFFAKAIKGIGLNPETRLEGIRVNNFIGTYLLGPLFILNPLFFKKIMDILKIEDYTLAFEEEIMAVYNKRLNEFETLDF
ncbi:MAG: hypothetical protein IKV94_01115 [Clostridia bacterium]|nr:hypothetical protein [Clostridia bacterium]